LRAEKVAAGVVWVEVEVEKECGVGDWRLGDVDGGDIAAESGVDGVVEGLNTPESIVASPVGSDELGGDEDEGGEEEEGFHGGIKFYLG